jgi:hypothetical protein
MLTHRALPWILLAALVSACGDDDDDDGSAQVAAACDQACQRIAGDCALPAPTVTDCSNGCQLGTVLAPACTGTYKAYIDCTRERPLVACSGDAVTVTASAPTCLAPLGDFLVCGVENINACVDLPLQDGECASAGLGNRAVACVGQAAGCALYEGSLRAGGFGLYCCP